MAQHTKPRAVVVLYWVLKTVKSSEMNIKGTEVDTNLVDVLAKKALIQNTKS